MRSGAYRCDAFLADMGVCMCVWCVLPTVVKMDDTRLLVFGGTGKRGVARGDVFAFDPRTNFWQKVATSGAPTGRHSAALVVRSAADLGDASQASQLVVLGGWNGEGRDGVVAVLTLPAKDPALDATPTPVFGELGTGRCEYPNGDVYDGRWDSNQRSGAGKVRRWCNLLPRAGEVCGSPGCARCAQCTYANGDVYEGEWKEDQRHGVGTVRVAGCLSCECRS